MICWALEVMLRARQTTGHASGDGREPPRPLGWDELVSMWSSSTTAVDVVHSVGARHALVALRAAILDELENLDPRRFATWIEGQYAFS